MSEPEGTHFRGPIWEGVYKHFKDTPQLGGGYDNGPWATRSLAKLAELRGHSDSTKTIPETVIYESSLLPFLAAIVSERREPVMILDFGGGVGITYVAAVDGLAEGRIEYLVLENGNICFAGQSAFSDDSRISFDTSVPENREVDIVHFGSSLHYVEDWKAILAQLAALHPKYFLLTDLPAGDIPTFATVQTFYGSKIPCWFFSLDEISAHFRDLGYKLVFKSSFRGTYFGVRQDIPQSNFPEEFRIRNTCSILFSRSLE